MIAERIHCTEAELRAAFRIQGLRPAGGPADGPDIAASISADSGLVGGDGHLTATARMILPLLAQPQRIITVSAATVGQNAVDSAMILAPQSGGPFVFRGDLGGMINLVALDSPTAALSLLDEMMVITGLPTASAAADVHLDRATWLGLLAASDADQAARLENQLARDSDSTPTFNAERLEHLIDEALGGDDTRWILGAEALVDRAFVEEGKATGRQALSGLFASGLAEPTAGNMAVLTEAGRVWTEMLSTFVRLSHVRILHVIDGSPVDIVGMTFFRSPTDVVAAQISSNDVTLMSLRSDVAAAMLRAAIEGVAESDIDSSPARTAGRDTTQAETQAVEWVYVLEPAEVRDLYDTSTIAGTLQPGTWYRKVGEEAGWARVADADGNLNGWVPAAKVFGQSEPPPAVPAPPPHDPTSAWAADHVVPPDGAAVWAAPDPARAAVGNLMGGTGIRLIEVLGAWARVLTENGADGWVDGRRLVTVAEPAPDPQGARPAAAPVAPAPGVPVDPVVAEPPSPMTTPSTGTAEVDTSARETVSAARPSRVSLVAAIALLVSALLPWWGEDGRPSFDTSLFVVWNDSYRTGVLTIGLLMLMVAVATLATLFMAQAARYRRLVGGIAVGISAMWLLMTFAYLLIRYGAEVGTAVADLFTAYFAIGPWIALAAGIVLLARR